MDDVESLRVRVPPVGRQPASWRLSNVPVPEPHLLGIAAGVLLHRLRPWVLPGSRNLHRLVGWPLIAAGTYLVVRSLAAASQVDLEHPDRLVTSGPYAVSRNPMYVGWALLHLGGGVAGGVGWIVATFPAAVGWVHREVLREERALGQDFGDELGRYRAAVPRYLPRWRSVRRKG
jgi:protein-S-isoprenylcysteine O-methyltransferase Ste14